MKNTFTILLLFITSQMLAQAPIDYYESTRDLTGDSLGVALNRLVADHMEFPYTSTATDVWDILKETDRDPNNPDNVILLYTGMSVDAAQEWNSGNGWAREHVWAKIHGDFGTSNGAGTDVHHLRPVHQPTNSARNSRWFDECEVPYDTLGNFKCADSWAWEPRDAVKGDIARMLFYMDVRYEGLNGELDLQVVDTIPSENHTKEPIHAKLSTLMKWHLADEVDDWERNRNEIIYNYQFNRNPFIDKPGFACLLWPEACEVVPIEEVPAQENQLSIFPNPNTGKFTIQLEIAEYSPIIVEVFDPIGRLLYQDNFLAGNGSVTQPVDISGLAPGIYFVRVKVAEETKVASVIKR